MEKRSRFTLWCGHCLVWSLSGVITVWCDHCLVCSEVSHFNPSAPTSNQAPVLCRMENEKGWAQLGVQIDITQKETDKCSFLRGWGGGGEGISNASESHSEDIDTLTQ